MKNVFHTPDCAARDPSKCFQAPLAVGTCRAGGVRSGKGSADDEVGNEKVPNGLRMTQPHCAVKLQ